MTLSTVVSVEMIDSSGKTTSSGSARTSVNLTSPIPPINSNRRESTVKSASAKSLPSSLKRTSSITGFHNRDFKIHTCCGILELNCLKLTSFLALLASLLAFTCLIVTISINFAIVTEYHTTLEYLDTSGTYYRELMKLSCRAAVVSSYNRTLSLEYVNTYNEYFTKYFAVMNKLISHVPTEILYWTKHNMHRDDLKSRMAINKEVEILSMVTSGNYTGALQSIDSNEYAYLLTGYNEEVQSIIDYVVDIKYNNAEMDLVANTISLIIVCVSLAIVVPVLIVFVVLSVKKDNTKEKQLRQVKKYMIMDTINDVALAEKFKDFCKQERSEENFALLETINEYKKLCERSFDIQIFLYDTDVLSNSDQASECTTSSNEDSSKKKNKNKKGYTEKDLADIEKKKFEVAFEIYTDFLDVRGDRSVNISKQFADNVKQHLDFFAKGENESMPETLFESVEYEMCVLMMDTHHRFKQFLELQLKEKKQILTNLKRKSNKK